VPMHAELLLWLAQHIKCTYLEVNMAPWEGRKCRAAGLLYYTNKLWTGFCFVTCIVHGWQATTEPAFGVCNVVHILAEQLYWFEGPVSWKHGYGVEAGLLSLQRSSMCPSERRL
jgi:hypothetical protein